jgi:two-component system response regulator QseB
MTRLNARLRALLRRQSGRATPTIEYGKLRFDPAAHTLTQDGQSVILSPREFAILQTLLKKSSRALA